MSAPLQRIGRTWDALFDEPGSLRAIAILRILLGPIVLVHLTPFLRAMLEGRDYADAFYLPWVSWLPEPSKPLYFALLCLCGLSAATLSLGLRSRWSALYTWAFVGYNLFLSQTHFHHNRAFLFINLTCVALLPCGNVLSLDAWLARRAGRPAPPQQASLWPMYLLRFEAVCVYAASGGSKLLDADWRSGLVTFDRVVRFRHRLEASIAPQWFIDLLTTRGFHTAFGKIAIATELFIATGLLWPRTRYAAAWIAIFFHLAIGIGLNVQIFSYLAISALVIWSQPRTRDRRLLVDTAGASRAGGRMLLWCARWLDWLGRFEVTTGERRGVCVIDRDGRELHGPGAARLVLSRCPLSFALLGPLLLPILQPQWDRLLHRAFDSPPA